MEDVLTVDVYCVKADPVPYYRLYVDNDLLTERDFLFDCDKQFVHERCVLNLAEGQHKVFISGEYSSSFELKNAVLNGVAVELDAVGAFKK